MTIETVKVDLAGDVRLNNLEKGVSRPVTDVLNPPAQISQARVFLPMNGGADSRFCAMSDERDVTSSRIVFL